MASARQVRTAVNPVPWRAASVKANRTAAAHKTLAYLQAGGSPEALMTAARRLIFLKGRDSHDYKFSSAALEDFYHATNNWRGRFLATSMFNLRGSGHPNNPLTQQIRQALNGNG